MDQARRPTNVERNVTFLKAITGLIERIVVGFYAACGNSPPFRGLFTFGNRLPTTLTGLYNATYNGTIQLHSDTTAFALGEAPRRTNLTALQAYKLANLTAPFQALIAPSLIQTTRPNNLNTTKGSLK